MPHILLYGFLDRQIIAKAKLLLLLGQRVEELELEMKRLRNELESEKVGIGTHFCLTLICKSNLSIHLGIAIKLLTF